MKSSLFVLAILLLTTVNVGAQEVQPISYNRDVRPILADKCFACHGADSATREAGLRLDVREDAVEFGALVPSDSDASSIVDRIFLDEDDDALMPPLRSHKKLTSDEKQLLVRWINEGAPYQPHWSFIAPELSQPPPVSRAGWSDNPIDAFVLSAMESQGLQPAPPADRRTLARRASLDITGMPPEPAWVDAFVADESPGAYDRYLDRLFASPAWGEHRARYWLDYARYADTHGIHFDNYREMWSYRDWVIDAFNRNMPFDRFSIEQLAGDLLPTPSLDQQIATGFNRCNMTTNEGGIIDEEYKVLYARDRTETTSAVWLGLTTGCAVCHDHKFDPISASEFYSLAAFFNNTTQPVRDGNKPDTPPIITVPVRSDRQRYQELSRLIPQAESSIDAMVKSAKAQVDAAEISSTSVASTLPGADDLVFHAPLGESGGRTTTALIDGNLVPLAGSADLKWADGWVHSSSLVVQDGVSLDAGAVGDFDLQDPFTVSAWIYRPKNDVNGSIVGKMDSAARHRGWDFWINGNRLAFHLIHEWPASAIKIISSDPLPAERWVHVAMVNEGAGGIEGLRLYVDGAQQSRREIANNSLGQSTIRTEAPLTIGSRWKDSFATGVRISDVRMYKAAMSGDQVALIGEATVAMFAASLAPDQRDQQRTDRLAQWHLRQTDAGYAETIASLEEMQSEQAQILSRATIAHVMNEKDGPAIAHILERGEYDQQVEQVAADVPAIFPPLGDRPANRLGLAQWLFDADHPLTARVTVNRFWQEVFGVGIVRTSGDFGVMGELPSHPELLDFLAIEFRESGWDVRELFRLMLTSATYQQSSVHSDASIAIDPANRWLSHGPRFRMHAEMVRDSALWASGLLSTKIGGPSVRPYQPPGVWEAVAMPESNTKNYQVDSGEAIYRRSMYWFWKRAAPPASMEILGAPNREVCTIQREDTNTPLQALVTLNDPQFVEAARLLAQSVLDAESVGNDAERLNLIAGRLMSRAWQDREREVLEQSLAALRTFYAGDPEQANKLIAIGQSKPDAFLGESNVTSSELAAWTMLCNEIMNLDEVLCK